MPELPEVETVRTGLEKAWLGRTISKVILRRPNLRYPFPEDFENRLVGQKIIAIRRRAKYLLIDTDGDLVFLSHLGMSGKYTIFDTQKVSHYDLNIPDSKSAFGAMSGFDGRHDHMEIRFDDGSVSVYTDPRRFGIVKLFHRAEQEIQPLLSVLGPEPFESRFNLEYIISYFKGKKKNIKNYLLDQNFVSGIGNIYASEILFLSKINPYKKVNLLKIDDYKKLIMNSRKILDIAIKKGGSSIKDFKNTSGKKGSFQKNFKVYEREGLKCKRIKCNGIIQKKIVSNRSTFFCNFCQNN